VGPTGATSRGLRHVRTLSRDTLAHGSKACLDEVPGGPAPVDGAASGEAGGV